MELEKIILNLSRRKKMNTFKKLSKMHNEYEVRHKLSEIKIYDFILYM